MASVLFHHLTIRDPPIVNELYSTNRRQQLRTPSQAIQYNNSFLLNPIWSEVMAIVLHDEIMKYFYHMLHSIKNEWNAGDLDWNGGAAPVSCTRWRHFGMIIVAVIGATIDWANTISKLYDSFNFSNNLHIRYSDFIRRFIENMRRACIGWINWVIFESLVCVMQSSNQVLGTTHIKHHRVFETISVKSSSSIYIRWRTICTLIISDMGERFDNPFNLNSIQY